MTKDPGTSPDPVGHFDETAAHYAATQYDDAIRSFMTVRQARVLEFVDALDLPPGADVLDAGCGPGYLVEQFAVRGFRVAGMDGAEGMLRIARARIETAPPPIDVTFKQGDIESLPYEAESFDLVCSTGVIEYLSDDVTVLADMYRVLRPGGHLVLPVTNAWSPVNWLDAPVEVLKRQRWFRRSFNRTMEGLGRRPIVPRHFVVRKHRPGRFRDALSAAGFRVVDQVYFYFLPWPRPIDKLLPRASATIGDRMERLGRSPMGVIAEGFLALAVKDGSQSR
jgi:ubiquinone/menaquinone biosynthesis C-methylase UbiE